MLDKPLRESILETLTGTAPPQPMRIAIATHGFPPIERTGVEGHAQALATALAARGHTVEVFAPRVAPELPERSLRREVRTVDGARFGVTWLTANTGPRDPGEMLDPPRRAHRFAEFLERERPDVVHFQHLVKLGVSCIDACVERRIPTIYTAHDYYALCHRYTLLRPDLGRCNVRGDAMACARCDLALGWLNEREGLGDYQMGALPEQLDDAGRAALAAILDGDPEDGGLHADELDAAFDRRLELDARRTAAFARVDRILAPTEFLRSELIAGGIEPAKIEVLGYGIERESLECIPPVPATVGHAQPVRFGFIGGLSKHKGVHVLLDAFGRMDVPAQLTVHGYSSDEPYVERLRERAAEVGAVLAGPFDRDDLPGVLAALDVVVVPSTWVENQPLVIREAFASGRPVVASDCGALPESVRDGIDGLLFETGDADALAAALTRFVTDEGLAARLAAGIEPVHEVGAQAIELEQRYTALVEAARAAAPAPDDLPSVAPFAARVRELAALPTRELFRRTLEGLAHLREGLGGDEVTGALGDVLGAALADGSRAQVALDDARHENDWMRASVRAEQEASRAIRDRMGWIEETIGDKDEAVGALASERDWMREQLTGKEQELAYLHEKVVQLENALHELQSHSDEIRAHTEEARANATAREQELHARQIELERIRAANEEVVENMRETAQLGLDALQAQEQVLGADVKPLLDTLRRLSEEDAEVTEGVDPSDLDAVAAASRAGVERLEKLEVELAWRRDQMQAMLDDFQSKIVRMLIVRTGVGRRLLRWEGGVYPHGAPFPDEEDAP